MKIDISQDDLFSLLNSSLCYAKNYAPAKLTPLADLFETLGSKLRDADRYQLYMSLGDFISRTMTRSYYNQKDIELLERIQESLK